jgi:hypothetical protein
MVVTISIRQEFRVLQVLELLLHAFEFDGILRFLGAREVGFAIIVDVVRTVIERSIDQILITNAL